MHSSAKQSRLLSNSLQAKLLRYFAFRGTRCVVGTKPRVVGSGKQGAVTVRLDHISRPLSEVALNAAIRFVRRRVWA